MGKDQALVFGACPFLFSQSGTPTVSTQISEFQSTALIMETASVERRGFSERLHQALRNADYPPDSPTQLAREFNLRFAGRVVTVHAARKWLVGEAIPTQEKLRALAQWLGVSAEWLRFGGELTEVKMASAANLNDRLAPKDVAMIEHLMQLDEQRRHVVHQLIRLLLQK
jgi:transcriptional regulator with XRE-family HTH domain